MKNTAMVIVCVILAGITVAASALITVKVHSANDAKIAAETTAEATTVVETSSKKEEKTTAETTKETTTQQETTKQTTTTRKETTVAKAQNKTNSSKLKFNKAYHNDSIEYLKSDSMYFLPRITFREDGTFVLEENMYLEGWVTYNGAYSVSGDTVSCDFLEYRVQEGDIDETGDINDSKGGTDHVEFKIEGGNLIIDRDLYTTHKGNVFVLY